MLKRIKKYRKAKKMKKANMPSAKSDYVDQKRIKQPVMKGGGYMVDHLPKEQDKGGSSLTPVGKSQKLIGQMKGVGGGGVPRRYKKRKKSRKAVVDPISMR